MPKNKLLFLGISLLAAVSVLYCLARLKPPLRMKTADAAKAESLLDKPEPPQGLGEKIGYEVTLHGIKVGESSYTYLSQEEISGKTLNLMLFRTELARFSDSERVFSDPETMLPVKVERSIKKWFSSEEIVEDYDQKDFSVTIRKTSGSNVNTRVIRKNTPINNAILLPQYLRRAAKLEIGTTIQANLPTRELSIKLVSIEEVSVPAGTFPAYHFQSTPKQIDVWVTTDQRHIPVKIEGNTVLGYSMAMKTYSEK